MPLPKVKLSSDMEHLNYIFSLLPDIQAHSVRDRLHKIKLNDLRSRTIGKVITVYSNLYGHNIVSKQAFDGLPEVLHGNCFETQVKRQSQSAEIGGVAITLAAPLSVQILSL